jgi:hypothetical protein
MRCSECGKEIKKKSKAHDDTYFCDNCQIYFGDMKEDEPIKLIGE